MPGDLLPMDVQQEGADTHVTAYPDGGAPHYQGNPQNYEDVQGIQNRILRPTYKVEGLKAGAGLGLATGLGVHALAHTHLRSKIPLLKRLTRDIPRSAGLSKALKAGAGTAILFGLAGNALGGMVKKHHSDEQKTASIKYKGKGDYNMNDLDYACYLAKTAADMEAPLEDTPATAPGSDDVADMVEAATNMAQQQVVADAVAKAQTEAAPNLIAAQEMLEDGAAPEGDVAPEECMDPEACEEEPQTAGEKMASLRYQRYLNKMAATGYVGKQIATADYLYKTAFDPKERALAVQAYLQDTASNAKKRFQKEKDSLTPLKGLGMAGAAAGTLYGGKKLYNNLADFVNPLKEMKSYGMGNLDAIDAAKKIYQVKHAPSALKRNLGIAGAALSTGYLAKKLYDKHVAQRTLEEEKTAAAIEYLDTLDYLDKTAGVKEKAQAAVAYLKSINPFREKSTYEKGVNFLKKNNPFRDPTLMEQLADVAAKHPSAVKGLKGLGVAGAAAGAAYGAKRGYDAYQGRKAKTAGVSNFVAKHPWGTMAGVIGSLAAANAGASYAAGKKGYGDRNPKTLNYLLKNNPIGSVAYDAGYKKRQSKEQAKTAAALDYLNALSSIEEY